MDFYIFSRCSTANSIRRWYKEAIYKWPGEDLERYSQIVGLEAYREEYS